MSASSILVGSIWADAHGEARVLAVVENYVMFRRPRCHPFLRYARDVLNKDMWRKVSDYKRHRCEPMQ